MADLVEGEDLLVVLLCDPLDPPTALAAEAVPQPFKPLAELGVLGRTLPQEATGPLDPFLGERADERRGVDRVKQVV